MTTSSDKSQSKTNATQEETGIYLKPLDTKSNLENSSESQYDGFEIRLKLTPKEELKILEESKNTPNIKLPENRELQTLSKLKKYYNQNFELNLNYLRNNSWKKEKVDTHYFKEDGGEITSCFDLHRYTSDIYKDNDKYALSISSYFLSEDKDNKITKIEELLRNIKCLDVVHKSGNKENIFLFELPKVKTETNSSKGTDIISSLKGIDSEIKIVLCPSLNVPSPTCQCSIFESLANTVSGLWDRYTNLR